MGNIFSGMLGGNNNAGGKLAYYKQQLEDYQDSKDATQQQQAVSDADPRIKQVIESMSPGRQDMMVLARGLMQNPATFDKGQEMMGSMVKQRGSSIQSGISQDQKFERYKAEREFLLAHPDPLDKTALAQDLELWQSLGDPDNPGVVTQGQKDLLKLKRKEQWFDQKDQHIDLYGNTIDKRLIEGGIKEEMVGEYSAGIANFYSDVNTMEDTLYDTQKQMKRIDELFATADNTTVGIGALTAMFGVTPAAEWARTRDVLISNIGLEKIMDLKASSAQGATGLGALNEAELKMLQVNLDNLSSANTPEEVKLRLAQMKKGMQQVQDRRMRDLKKRRTWYHKNKHFDPLLDPTEPDLIDSSQDRLFTGRRYTMPEIETPGLGIPDANLKDTSDEDLMKQINNM